MSGEDKTMEVVVIVIVVALAILALQSCSYEHPGLNDETVMEVGRERFYQTVPAGKSVEITSEKVVRPGLHGGELGYQMKYRIRDENNNWIEKEYYDE